ncbi:MAG: hypothetical protein LBP19_02975 [Treponema sp.]|jgi:hypothetical protein|nr:hypothetical protein [Treponema sp.]
MNITPTIYDNTGHSYTVVGGMDRGAATGLSAVLLNRNGHYSRRMIFQELEKIGFDFIVSMEGPHERYDIEELSGRFPHIRFILLKDEISIGEQINIAALEISSSLFFVIWNDLRILHSGGAFRMTERLLLSADELAPRQQNSQYKRLCTVPLIQNSRFETLPTLIAPALYGNSVKTLSFVPAAEGKPSLYPFDWVGIYDRERFLWIGGFDTALTRPHWQLMDFGFRAHLWGEEISSTQLIRISYDGDISPEDSTTEYCYRRFYLKNIAPVFRGDSAYLPLRRFPAFLRRSNGQPPFTLWKEFISARQWVKKNSFRFKNDARSITELWDDFSELSEPAAAE